MQVDGQGKFTRVISVTQVDARCGANAICKRGGPKQQSSKHLRPALERKKVFISLPKTSFVLRKKKSKGGGKHANLIGQCARKCFDEPRTPKT